MKLKIGQRRVCCHDCGRHFWTPARNAKFCKRCAAKRKPKKRIVQRTCPQCGQRFSTDCARRVYCGQKCSVLAHAEQKRKHGDMIHEKRAALSSSVARTMGAVQREDHGCYMPTPEQIAAACAEIQASWSEAECQRRQVQANPRAFFHRFECRRRNGKLTEILADS